MAFPGGCLRQGRIAPVDLRPPVYKGIDVQQAVKPAYIYRLWATLAPLERRDSQLSNGADLVPIR